VIDYMTCDMFAAAAVTSRGTMAVGRRAHLGMALVCGSCRQRFHSASELQRHRASALCRDDGTSLPVCNPQDPFYAWHFPVIERYGCPHCSKDFGNRQILRLHMRVHEECTTPVPPTPTRNAETAQLQDGTAPTSTAGLRPPLNPRHPCKIFKNVDLTFF
jgi:hypothetical protein